MRLNVISPGFAVIATSALLSGVALAQITAVPPASYNPPVVGKSAGVNRLLSSNAPIRLVALPPPAAKERELLKSLNALPSTGGKLGPAASATGKGRPLAVGYGREFA